MKKIYVITGSRGVGKSTAIATFPPPSEIGKLLVLDTEDSMSDLADLGFKHVRMYERLRVGGDMLDQLAKGEVPWVDEKGRNALVRYYEFLIEVLNKELEPGRYRYVGIDTIEPIEMAMTAAVESGRRVFGWSGTRAYGRMETEGVRPLYEGLMEAIAQRGVEYIIIASHLKNVWVDDRPVVGKVQPGGRLKVLSRLSSAMFWLVPGSDPSGAPAGIVLKARMGRVRPAGDDWVIRRVLPERIPAFTWKAVERYRTSPADLENPAPGETASDSERQMISELLSDEQMRLMILAAEQGIKDTKDAGMVVKPAGKVDVMAKVASTDGRNVALSMMEGGASNKQVAESTGLSLPEVLKLRSES